jgi:hypothetical protein
MYCLSPYQMPQLFLLFYCRRLMSHKYHEREHFMNILHINMIRPKQKAWMDEYTCTYISVIGMNFLWTDRWHAHCKILYTDRTVFLETSSVPAPGWIICMSGRQALFLRSCGGQRACPSLLAWNTAGIVFESYITVLVVYICQLLYQSAMPVICCTYSNMVFITRCNLT